MAGGIPVTLGFDVFSTDPIDKQRTNFNTYADLLALPLTWRHPMMECKVLMGAERGKYTLKGLVNANPVHNDNWVKENFIEAVEGKQLSDENFTSDEKAKLAGLVPYYKGTYPSLSALEAAFPVGQPGWYAIVDVVGETAVKYIWDDTDGVWVLGGGSSAGTFAEIGGSPLDNAALNNLLATKVNNVAGKVLSSNDFDATAKGKVDNLPSDTNTELGLKANDNAVLKLTGNQTANGEKHFPEGFSGTYIAGTTITGNVTIDANYINKYHYVEAAAVITIPSGLLSRGNQIKFIRDTAGEVDFLAGGSTDLRSAGNRKRIAEQNAAAELIAKSPTVVHLFGALKI